MRLEEEIKQSKFESEQQKAVLNIMVTSNWITSNQTKLLKKFDLSPPQYNVLRILRGAKDKPVMLADISSRMLDKMSNATRLVEKLKQKGLVNREQCEVNRRQVDISITEQGLQLLLLIDAPMKDMTALLSHISTKEAQVLNEILDKWRK